VYTEFVNEQIWRALGLEVPGMRFSSLPDKAAIAATSALVREKLDNMFGVWQNPIADAPSQSWRNRNHTILSDYQRKLEDALTRERFYEIIGMPVNVFLHYKGFDTPYGIGSNEFFNSIPFFSPSERAREAARRYEAINNSHLSYITNREDHVKDRILSDLFQVINDIMDDDNLTPAQKSDAMGYVEQIIRLQTDRNYRREYERNILNSIN
jgi:hypothetical protein